MKTEEKNEQQMNEEATSTIDASQEAEQSSNDLEIERKRSNELEAKLQDVAEDMRKSLPEPLQKLIPSGLSISEQIGWMNTAAGSDLAKKRVVPTTDIKPPATQQKRIDPNELPPVKRIAMSYGATQ